MWTLTQEVETSAGVLAADKAGRGRSLVLAHGWPWSSYSWHKLISVLCESFEAYWYDMLGYGMSEKYPDQRTGLDVQAEIFCEMVEHWDLVNPIVLAHDFGGATTLRAHLLHVASLWFAITEQVTWTSSQDTSYVFCVIASGNS